MLISSVNFINRGRTEKYYRREKGDILKDETPQELTYCKKHADKVSKLKKGYQLKGPSETVSLTPFCTNGFSHAYNKNNVH